MAISCFVCGKNIDCECAREESIKPKYRSCAMGSACPETPHLSMMYEVGNDLRLIHVCCEACLSALECNTVRARK